MGLLNSVAAQGRSGDTRLAHVTPGEVVIPKEVAALRPDLVAHVSDQIRQMGGNPSRLTVGRGRVNPQTGIEEFATEEEVRKAYQTTLGRDADAGGLQYWMAQDDLSGFQSGAKAEIAGNVGSQYQSLFGRDADTGGQKFWTDAVNNGSITSMSGLTDALKGGAQTQDQSAMADGAKYPTSWNGSLNANAPDLTYDAAKDKWVNPTNVAPIAAGSVATYTPVTQSVDQAGLVQNQMAGLLNSDSSYMQSARLRAQQAGQASGLLNSSLAATSGEKAASDAALSIATPDAAAVNTQSLTNQAALNTAGQFNANWANDFSKLALQQQYALDSAGYGAELQAGLNSQSQSAAAALAVQQAAATAAQNSQSQAAIAAQNAQQQAATAAQNTQQQAATAAQNTQQQAAAKATANASQAQTIYTAMNELKTEASKYVTSIMADTTLDDAAKAATIKSYLATAEATQSGYNAQLAVINYTPGAYFDFSTLSGS